MRSLAVGEMQFEACVAIRNKKDNNIITIGQSNNGLPRLTREVLPKMIYRTIIVTARNHRRAKEMAGRIGLVQWCRKVDPYYELYKIEHLNLHQEIQITTESYELGDNFEITPIDKE